MKLKAKDSKFTKLFKPSVLLNCQIGHKLPSIINFVTASASET